MTRWASLFAACLIAPLALASPSAPRPDGKMYGAGAKVVRSGPLVSREPGAPMVRRNGLVARTDTRSISFEQTLENEPLFNSSDITLFPGPSIEVVCRNCCSKGSVDATFPSDLTDIVNPKFRIDLTGVEALVELDVAGLFVDLVLQFELSGEVDMSGGFYFKIPDGSFFEIDITEEGLHSEDFTGVVSKVLPITINRDTSAAEIKIALQLRASWAGAELNVNVGAFARIGASFADEFFGIEPTVTTTLFALPIPTACLVPLGQQPAVRVTPCPPRAPSAIASAVAPGVSLPPDVVVVDPVTTIHITRTVQRTETVPTPVVLAKRTEGVVAQLTAVACATAAVVCPAELRSTVTYEATVCPPAATRSAACFGRETATATVTVDPTAAFTVSEAPPVGFGTLTRDPLPTPGFGFITRDPAGASSAATTTTAAASADDASASGSASDSASSEAATGGAGAVLESAPLGLATLTISSGAAPTPGNAAAVGGDSAGSPPLGLGTASVVPGSVPSAALVAEAAAGGSDADAPPIGLSTITTNVAGAGPSAVNAGAAASTPLQIAGSTQLRGSLLALSLAALALVL
ncbi:unnamed protein product [Parascedosporium putredinis]|uniref:Uncharacterized protein n=1 Tax=Parascedosporium putredinis TaxID=1442378 RepID=A0A9P1H7Z9_9PEZI|nr:unnamed protein product [Parascedosporium putredinis]CAI7999375.1 unnamed protein product [Parascedosporium putredinis]